MKHCLSSCWRQESFRKAGSERPTVCSKNGKRGETGKTYSMMVQSARMAIVMALLLPCSTRATITSAPLHGDPDIPALSSLSAKSRASLLRAAAGGGIDRMVINPGSLPLPTGSEQTTATTTAPSRLTPFPTMAITTLLPTLVPTRAPTKVPTQVRKMMGKGGGGCWRLPSRLHFRTRTILFNVCCGWSSSF